MSGWAIAFGPCICCKHIFGFNPTNVPSTTALTGEREPVCAGCMTLINARRRANGLREFNIAADAYEPVEGSEL